MRTARGAHGFTLVEVLVAVAVGGFAVTVAAAMARVTVKKSGQGAEQTNMVGTSRVLGHQLRSDLRIAALGSTGAIGVFAGTEPWMSMRVLTPGAGLTALPAVSGVDAHPGGGAGDILPGSDVIQVVVPESAENTTTRTQVFAAQGSSNLSGERGLPCELAYLFDATSANGAGRTQLFRVVPGSNPIQLAAGERLVFEVPAGALVTCARISTYWASRDGYLWRSDIDGRGPLDLEHVGGTVYLQRNNMQRLAPGLVDLQLAYRLSSEAGIDREGAEADAWAFDDEANLSAETALQRTPAAWFEVRQVRFSVLLRSARKVDDPGDSVTLPRMENRQAELEPLSRAFRFHQITSGEVLMNARFFDQNTPASTPAEPW